MSTVLFVCRQNAGRSQMARLLFEQGSLRGAPDRCLGLQICPGPRVDPVGVNPGDAASSESTWPVPLRRAAADSNGLAEQADVVVTMGCGDQSPVHI